jgi:hypothetical protein
MELTVASFALAPRRRWWDVRPALLVALALSSAVHFAISLLPDELPTVPDPTPLSASIRELPPPPTPKAGPAPARPKPRRAAPAPIPAPTEAPVEEAVSEASQAEAPKAAELAPTQEAPTTAAAPEPAVLAEEVSAPAEAAPAKVLPPRVDLTYKVLYGAGFHVGTLTYRFEHADNRYTISTLGEARGLAALFVRGQGRVQSRGVITGNGLQPLLLEVDRFNERGRERAEFDWETGIATLHEDKVAPLELPTFDPLTMMWQFYFQPPDGTAQTFALATTRRVNRVTVRRERTETIEWNGEKLATEVWHRTSDDGKTEAYVWLAPGLRWIPVKVRAEHATRGTVEAVLDAIRVDEPLAQAPDK